MTKTKITKRGSTVTVEEIEEKETPYFCKYFDKLYPPVEAYTYGVFVDWSGDSYRGSGW